jgi:hypothetical protein
MCEEERQQQVEQEVHLAEFADAAAAAAAAEALPDAAGSEAVEFLQQVSDMHNQLLDFEGQLQGLGEGLDGGVVQTTTPPPAAAYQQQQSDEEAPAAPSGAGRNNSSSSRLKNARSGKGASASSKAAIGGNQGVNKQQALSQLRARQQQHLQHKAAAAAAAAVQKRGVPGASKAPVKGSAAAAAARQPVPVAAAQQGASWIEESLLVVAGPAQAVGAASAGATGEAGVSACSSSSRVVGRLATVQDKLAAKLQEQREALHAQRQQLQREREQYQSQAAAGGSAGAGAGSSYGQGLGSRSSSRVLLQQAEQDPVLVENEQVEVMFLNDLEESAAFAALESSPPAAQRKQHMHDRRSPGQGHSSASHSMGAGSPVEWREAVPVCSSPVPRSAVATPVPAAVALRQSGTKAAGLPTWGWNSRGLGPDANTWQDGVGAQQEEGYGDSYDGGVQATPQPAQQPDGSRAGSSTGKSRAGLGPSSWRAYMQEEQDWVPPADSS